MHNNDIYVWLDLLIWKINKAKLYHHNIIWKKRFYNEEKIYLIKTLQKLLIKIHYRKYISLINATKNYKWQKTTHKYP